MNDPASSLGVPAPQPLAVVKTAEVEEICVPVPSAGGLVGLFVSDRARINAKLKEYNAQGYRLTNFNRAARTNLVFTILQILCLLLTLGIWSPAVGGLLFFRRKATGG